HGDRETRRRGEKTAMSPCLRVSVSPRPILSVPVSPCLRVPSLESAGKQSRETQDRQEACQRLPLLQAITRHNHLVAGIEIDRVGRLPLINGGDVDGNRLEISVSLFAQHIDLALVARLQN